MTPETKTPRDEALEIFERMVSYSEFMLGKFSIQDVDKVRAALSTPEAVENDLPISLRGLKVTPEMVFGTWYEEHGQHWDKGRPQAEQAYLAGFSHAQGRTQAVPDGWKLVPTNICMRDKNGDDNPDHFAWMGRALCALPEGKGGSNVEMEIYGNAILSAAPTPPVTGSAWIKVDPENVYQGYFAWIDEDCDDQEPIVCAWPPMDKYAKCFKRGYYYPLPAQPESGE